MTKSIPHATAYYTHPACRLHDMGPGHPECPQRLDAIEDRLLASGLDIALTRLEAPPARREDLHLAHSDGYLLELDDMLSQLNDEQPTHAVDPDTVAMRHTREAMLHAAGAAIAATDAVLDREVRNAFCAVRPPGHHATRDKAMGFCFVNNVCIAARHALDVRGLQRVLIVDFDVHHGNGTEDIIAGDDRVLMASFFQDQIYPFNGGVPLGDNMINVPVPAYTRGMDVREMIEMYWIPRIEEFKPQMMFISAGFDAHREDDLGQLGLVESDYEWITRRLVQLADTYCESRIVSCLEGGYALSSLARSVAAHIKVLAGV